MWEGVSHGHLVEARYLIYGGVFDQYVWVVILHRNRSFSLKCISQIQTASYHGSSQWVSIEGYNIFLNFFFTFKVHLSRILHTSFTLIAPRKWDSLDKLKLMFEPLLYSFFPCFLIIDGCNWVYLKLTVGIATALTTPLVNSHSNR